MIILPSLFGMMEFIARVKAVLRRSARQNEDKELHYGGTLSECGAP